MKAGRFGRLLGTKSCSLWSVAHLTRERCLADATGAFTQRALRLGARPSCSSGCCGDAVQRQIPGTAHLHSSMPRESGPPQCGGTCGCGSPIGLPGSWRSRAPGPSLFCGVFALGGARRGGVSRGESGASRGASGNSSLRPSFSRASHRAGPAACVHGAREVDVRCSELFSFLGATPCGPKGVLYGAQLGLRGHPDGSRRIRAPRALATEEGGTTAAAPPRTPRRAGRPGGTCHGTVRPPTEGAD